MEVATAIVSASWALVRSPQKKCHDYDHVDNDDDHGLDHVDDDDQGGKADLTEECFQQTPLRSNHFKGHDH